MAAAIGFKASVRVRVPGPSGWAGRTSQSDHISSPWATVPGQTFKLTAGPCGYDSESASESEARFPGSPSAGGRRQAPWQPGQLQWRSLGPQGYSGHAAAGQRPGPRNRGDAWNDTVMPR